MGLPKATARVDSRLKLTFGKLVSKSTHHVWQVPTQNRSFAFVKRTFLMARHLWDWRTARHCISKIQWRYVKLIFRFETTYVLSLMNLAKLLALPVFDRHVEFNGNNVSRCRSASYVHCICISACRCISNKYIYCSIPLSHLCGSATASWTASVGKWY